MLAGFTQRVVHRPWTAIFVAVLITAAFGSGVRQLRADTDVTNDLPQRIEAKRLYDAIEKLFPSKEMIIVGTEGKELFTKDGVARLARFTKRMQDVRQVHSVIGPTNARIISAAPEGMVVREAAATLPQSDAEAQGIKERLLAQPMLRGSVISADGGAVCFLVLVRAGMREADAAEQLIALAKDPARNEGLTLYVAGRPAATYWAKVIMGRDMSMLSSAALGIVILVLLVSFRSGRGVLLPLGVVVASVVSTLGLMGHLGVPITHSTEVMPILLIAIGVADGIHVLKGYYSRARGAHDRHAVVQATMGDLNRPVVLTSLTTAIGFSALNTSGIASIMMLGLFTAFGVMVAMFFSLTFLPAVLVLLKLPQATSRSRGARFLHFERFAQLYASLLVRRRAWVALTVLGVVALAIYGATRVSVEMSSIENFRPTHPLRVATDWLNQRFGGTNSLIVVAKGGQAGALKRPEVLAQIEGLERYAATQAHVRSVRSLTGFIKQMHRVMHDDAPTQYRIPKMTEQETGVEVVEQEGVEVERPVTFKVEGRKLIAQYLTLYEMSGKPEDFANLVTYDYSTAKVSLLLDTYRVSELNVLSAALRRYIKENFHGVEAELTGMAELLRAVNEMVISGQAWSIATSLLLVFLFSALMFRSATLGLFCTLPLFFSLFLNFGVMGISGIALNVMTMATSSVAVGVGIDYAIHFVHRFQQARINGDDFDEAVPSTMRTSGVAITLNALTVAAGFSALVFSEFTGVAQMGFLIALTMVTSAFAALTILPVLFVYLKPRAFTHAAAKEPSS
ncbi:MAG: RND family transporter [Deltaproteobacteria bacterium]|nr:RND family transporter [Deltaproteobacteria bacterium]